MIHCRRFYEKTVWGENVDDDFLEMVKTPGKNVLKVRNPVCATIERTLEISSFL